MTEDGTINMKLTRQRSGDSGEDQDAALMWVKTGDAL